MENFPVASTDLIDGSFDTSAVGVMFTIRPLSIKMDIPGVSLPSWVSTRVTPSNRSLPEIGISTFGLGWLRHPESDTAKQAISVASFKKARDMDFAFRRMRSNFLPP